MKLDGATANFYKHFLRGTYQCSNDCKETENGKKGSALNCLEAAGKNEGSDLNCFEAVEKNKARNSFIDERISTALEAVSNIVEVNNVPSLMEAGNKQTNEAPKVDGEKVSFEQISIAFERLTTSFYIEGKLQQPSFHTADQCMVRWNLFFTISQHVIHLRVF